METVPEQDGRKRIRSSKGALTSIFNSMASIRMDEPIHSRQPVAPSSSLASLQGESAGIARTSLLTLHFLFPHELLPALDLLDRKLVHQHRCRLGEHGVTASEVFYIQSASAVTDPGNRRATSSRFRNAWNPAKVHYEVRLDSWNCTCAAFAQSHLKLLLGGQDDGEVEKGRMEDDCNWVGGEATRSDAPIPICKHILAAALFKAAPDLFEADVDVKDVSREEMAGWSAGWGEI